MAPKKSQHGASASTRRTPSRRVACGVPSPGTRIHPASPPSARGRAVATPRPAKPARKKPGSYRDGAGYRWWLLPVVVIGAIGLFVAAFYPVARVEYRETREKAALQSQLGAIQSRNARLRAQVARLKTPEGIEDCARSQLGLVKKGEHVVVVVDGTSAKRATPVDPLPEIDSQETTAAPPVGPWTAFLDAFFGVQ